MRLVRRGHSSVIGRKLRRLLTTLYARPAIPALDEVSCCLALIVLDLETGDVRGQPVYPGKATCYRVCVLIFQHNGNRSRVGGGILYYEGQRIGGDIVLVELRSPSPVLRLDFPLTIPLLITFISETS